MKWDYVLKTVLAWCLFYNYVMYRRYGFDKTAIKIRIQSLIRKSNEPGKVRSWALDNTYHFITKWSK